MPKLYLCPLLGRHVFFLQTLAGKQYDNLCLLLNVLRYIINGSPAPLTGFPKLLSFGLPKKIRLIFSLLSWSYWLFFPSPQHISAWCTSLCVVEPDGNQRDSWKKAADDLLFTLAVSGDRKYQFYRMTIFCLPV